ncbi:perlucin-like protein isoform X2 [Argopecten irradians]|uniref:C-type lectin n=1 Tax=Argopecten irradians TaxID=31199 RepID=H8XW48_ARGIR|nr:C-type lectin [Argopecten irradians]
MMFCIGLVILAFVQAQASCPHGWTLEGTSCYHIGREELTWTDAQRMCEHHKNSYLARVETEVEDKAIQEMIRAQGHHSHKFWLGATDWTVEGEWQWEPEGSASFTYSNWAHHQPNDHGGNDNCMSMEGESMFHWYDDNCSNKKKYICETAPSVDMTTVEYLTTKSPSFQTDV